MPRRATKKDLAGEAWRAMSEAVLTRHATGAAAFGEHGLTPGHIRTLLALDDEPRPMRWLADRFALDPSTVTWIVDRLEQRGLVTRKPLSTDRRMKAVVLTRRGQQTKAKLDAMLYEPPAELLELPAATLAALGQALSGIGAMADEDGDGAATAS